MGIHNQSNSATLKMYSVILIFLAFRICPGVKFNIDIDCYHLR